MDPATVMVDAGDLEVFAQRVLELVGMPADDARRAASAMVWADLRGLPAHGVGTKLLQCVGRIQGGGTAADAPFTIVADAGALILVDGGTAWGQVAGGRGMELAVERARTLGIAAVSVRDVNSAGAMGHYVTLAADAGMIGLAFTNGSPIMAPWGGAARVLGNQGHAIGCPTAGSAPVVYDSALTVMSTGELDTMHEAGRSVAAGVVFDADGNPTTDPGAWFTGMLAPMGGHRGYGLAFMFELLTGVLSGGSRFAPDVGHPSEVTIPQGVSLLLVAIDPATVTDLDRFTERVRVLIERVHAVRPASGTDRVLYPGEQSGERARDRRRLGIPLAPQHAAKLQALGAEVGVPWPGEP